MASLFIKDGKTAAEVRRMAQRLRTTQTETVRRGMQALERELRPGPAEATDDFIARFDAWQRENPLPPSTGRKSDKAFFDRLWDEPA
ncbi:type II toxin-antitoxin system VapB family antitoxin [Sphingomonas sp.]|jgi:hypothetical protein|uniref:type II toxin-antitoxin system VapB family antitoxin n=1 Tax=Sphingomonas sp. TaxID=28214 RepID=UPI002E358838|nr:type II toxin-antitoxin system VapB family antitoxin [Sphingomonas sp.]HEX4696004.1 type II toxin-antitoxin system VapB family antitoxin [Sphingomonas sp.]